MYTILFLYTCTLRMPTMLVRTSKQNVQCRSNSNYVSPLLHYHPPSLPENGSASQTDQK